MALAAGMLPALLAACSGVSTSGSVNSSTLTWMPSYTIPGTPSRYDRVGILKVGAPGAHNVIVFEPGTSEGSGYFVPLARWIVSAEPGWQVWAVERRQNLLEDQSELNLGKQHKATATAVYDYYLGYLKDPSITRHFDPLPSSADSFAKQWGMRVAVEDLHAVIQAAKKLGGKVVLGGHSLGGSVVTAYATWDFDGRAGADDLNGLVYDDGASGPAGTPEQASAALAQLDSAKASPWLAFGGIVAPYAGVYSAAGALAALQYPNTASLGQTSGLLPPDIVPAVPVSNVGQFGYALNVASSPQSLIAAQAHLGTGLDPQAGAGGLHGWDSSGALTPIDRYATMLAGYPLQGVDGTEWYFPERLTIDTMAVDNGNPNPAQSVLDVDATMGHALPKSLRIYAFGARLGGQEVLDAASQLARQSGIPTGNLTLVNRQNTYAHNDPAGAYPDNAFFDNLVAFLNRVGQ